MNFPTLKSYVDWRNQMRTEYKALSKTIRQTKNKIAEDFRQNEYAGALQINLIILKSQATDMLEQRKEAKVIARNSWEIWTDKKYQDKAA